MDALRREKAVQMRVKEQLSYSRIAKKLGVPKSTLSYWLKDLPLSEKRITELRRVSWRKGEASRERFRNTMRKKKEEKAKQVFECYQKRFSKISDEAYFTAGLALYMGEGDKKNTARIGLVNTNPQIISFFVQWLSRFFSAPREKIRIQLNLYPNMKIAQEELFWRKILGFGKEQFYKSSIRKIRPGSFSYKDSSRHGTCGVYFNSTQKKTELMMAIKALIEKFHEKR